MNLVWDEDLVFERSMFEPSEAVSFVSLVETTSSQLFVEGCSAASDTLAERDFYFEVFVPPVDSERFQGLQALLRTFTDGVREHPRKMAPIVARIQGQEGLLGWSTERQVKFASELINRFLRAYEHTYFDLLLPRHRLDGRAVVLLAPKVCSTLRYTPVHLSVEDIVTHYLPQHSDVEELHLGLFMAEPAAMPPSWRILIDGIRHFENGHLREAVLCACSAAEILASPAVDRWLRSSTLDGGGDTVPNAIREMGNPLRFDLCISTVYKAAFVSMPQSEKVELLAQLRAMNSLRNRVVHAGEEPEAALVAASLRASAAFVCGVWLESLRKPR